MHSVSDIVSDILLACQSFEVETCTHRWLRRLPKPRAVAWLMMFKPLPGCRDVSIRPSLSTAVLPWETFTLTDWSVTVLDWVLLCSAVCQPWMTVRPCEDEGSLPRVSKMRLGFSTLLQCISHLDSVHVCVCASIVLITGSHGLGLSKGKGVWNNCSIVVAAKWLVFHALLSASECAWSECVI